MSTDSAQRFTIHKLGPDDLDKLGTREDVLHFDLEPLS
jgi:hypothetical protein